MLATIREGDTAARYYGGDEFCFIMPNVLPEPAVGVCKRLSKRFTAKAGSEISFSIAQTGPDKHLSAGDLVKQDDKLMYLAKTESKKSDGHWIAPANSNPQMLGGITTTQDINRKQQTNNRPIHEKMVRPSRCTAARFSALPLGRTARHRRQGDCFPGRTIHFTAGGF